MELGPDICGVVLAGMRDRKQLTAESMKLFLHAHLTRLDLGGYNNTTQQFVDTICKLSTLMSLNLRHCSKIVDFSPLSACRGLEVLDLSDTKLTAKHLAMLSLPQLAVLKIARTKVSQLPDWLPVETMVELDVQQSPLDDHVVPAIRRLRNLRHLNVADTGIRIARFGCKLLCFVVFFFSSSSSSYVSLKV